MSNSKEESLVLLRESLKDAQDTARAYDTKAQIVGVGYIFALNVIGNVGEQVGPTDEANVLSIIVAWIFVVFPIFLFGFVLYPTRKMLHKIDTNNLRPTNHVLFFEPSPSYTIEELKQSVSECDPIDEVAYELLKVSNLREIKRSRFLRALFAAGLSFVVLFAVHIYQVVQ